RRSRRRDPERPGRRLAAGHLATRAVARVLRCRRDGGGVRAPPAGSPRAPARGRRALPDAGFRPRAPGWSALRRRRRRPPLGRAPRGVRALEPVPAPARPRATLVPASHRLPGVAPRRARPARARARAEVAEPRGDVVLDVRRSGARARLRTRGERPRAADGTARAVDAPLRRAFASGADRALAWPVRRRPRAGPPSARCRP